MKISYLGPIGTFSYEAAKTILGEYVFWIDFENDITNKSIPILLDEIKKDAHHLEY